MPDTTTHVIRLAGDADEAALRRLALLDSQRPLSHPVLVAEIDGQPVAAIALTDRRVVADPFRRTADLRVMLHARADAFDAHARSPRVVERLRAAVRAPRPLRAV
jgi:hypothetical protein